MSESPKKDQTEQPNSSEKQENNQSELKGEKSEKKIPLIPLNPFPTNNEKNNLLESGKSETIKLSPAATGLDKDSKQEIPHWNTFQIDEQFGFKRLDNQLREKILTESLNIDPIIQHLFDRITDICVNNFNFGSNPIEFDQYLSFFKEVNRLLPKLQKKIMIDDCKSSVFFVGDSHGSIEDTYLTVKFFQDIVNVDPNAKFVFIGDYVDRNPWDLQNLVYVTAFYFLYPKNVILLRGNHEDRVINTHYGFIDNLLRAFYDQGNELYEEILKFFKHLPIATISQLLINNDVKARVLSVHGGIPVDQFDFFKPLILTEIEPKLVCEVEQSEDMDPFTVSMLWADPDEMIQGIVTDDQGSGRLRFGKPIFDGFMASNNLHLLVRGHQKWNEGCRIFFDNRLYSLFSTSKYDDHKKFNPKILNLRIGQVSVIPIEEKDLNSFLNQYKPEINV